MKLLISCEDILALGNVYANTSTPEFFLARIFNVITSIYPSIKIISFFACPIISVRKLKASKI